MTLDQSFLDEIPADTARLARAVFADDNVYVMIGDNLKTLLADTDFSCVYRANSRYTVPPGLLAMVLVFQLMEGLADDQVAINTQARIDWKYALHLSLNAPGIELSVFVDFRQRLLSHQTGMQQFNRLMGRLVKFGLSYPWHKLNASNGVLQNYRPVI